MQISQSAARHKYVQHKSRAKKRGIEFKLTFEQWRDIWGDKLDQIGVRAWQLGMCRINDSGAYEVGNVYLGTPARNAASRRMANENRDGKEGKHVWCAGSREPIAVQEEETDEEYLARKLGYASSYTFR